MERTQPIRRQPLDLNLGEILLGIKSREALHQREAHRVVEALADDVVARVELRGGAAAGAAVGGEHACEGFDLFVGREAGHVAEEDEAGEGDQMGVPATRYRGRWAGGGETGATWARVRRAARGQWREEKGGEQGQWRCKRR